MRILSFATCAVLLVGIPQVAVRADAADNAGQLASFRAVAFGKVTSASVAKIIDLRMHKLAAPNGGDFHGFAVISPWQALEPKSREALAALLRSPIDYWVMAYATAGNAELVKLSSLCLPDPGYAVHLETDRGPRDFAICLLCDDVVAYGERGKSADFSLDAGPLKALKKCYRGEFGDC